MIEFLARKKDGAKDWAQRWFGEYPDVLLLSNRAPAHVFQCQVIGSVASALVLFGRPQSRDRRPSELTSAQMLYMGNQLADFAIERGLTPEVVTLALEMNEKGLYDEENNFRHRAGAKVASEVK